MNRIELIAFKDEKETYELIHKWCSQKYIYEWFEQRALSYIKGKEVHGNAS